LACERFDSLFVRKETDVKFGRRGQRRALLPRFATTKIRSLATIKPSTTTHGPRRTAAITVGAILIPPPTGRSVPARRPGAATVTTALGSLVTALVFGVLGRGRLLSPGGQKEFFEIKIAIR
jgi:hypothetical protein